ncbi:MAG: major capsid protein [Proteobacteria bacterium]|nr:major capsid protein [Pseudomonadota bacterium]
MDDLFKMRVLTAAVNEMQNPALRVFNRVFRGREHLEPSDRLAFDVISGNETLLGTISVAAPASVTEKTGRRTITMTAPRLAHKRLIHTAELNALRAYGVPAQVEMMKTRIAREQLDMRNMIDRTLEYWACSALKGIIYDADLSTQLVDYHVAGSHKPTLTGTDLWTDAESDPIGRIRTWKRLIEDDAGASITGWTAFLGSSVMDALLTHDSVREVLRYDRGSQMAETGRIQRLAEVELSEYNGSFLDSGGVRRRFIDEDAFLLIGHCQDLVDVPFAPVVDDEAPGGVGNLTADGGGALYFSKSWQEKDPSGRWIKVEARPLPVLQRPGAVVYAKAV